jgi:hypothetical protein
MKILLDECVTRHLKPYLNTHEVATVVELGWSGIKNGRLMALCAEHHFDILLTIDKNLQYQQNLDKYPLTIVVLNSFSSKIEVLIKFLPALGSGIEQFEKHKAYLPDI